MAPAVGVNLNEVVEKPRLPAGQPLTFAFRKAQNALPKNPNKKTGKIEPYIGCELFPLEPEWTDRTVYHNWSLSPGSLASDDPVWSIKKFFTVVDFQWNPNGDFTTEDLLTIKFTGTVRYKEGDNRPQLATVIKRSVFG